MLLRRLNSQLIFIAKTIDIFHVIFPVFFSSYKQIRASYQCDCFTHIKKEHPGPGFSWAHWGRVGIHRITTRVTCLRVEVSCSYYHRKSGTLE